MLAADLGHAAAVRLDEAVWRGVADYVRLVSLPSESKSVTRWLAVQAADRLSITASSSETLQVTGMLHLSAAFSAATCEREDETLVHLDEARRRHRRTQLCDDAVRSHQRRILGDGHRSGAG
jgi:conjugal transfer/entry exclusion protein